MSASPVTLMVARRVANSRYQDFNRWLNEGRELAADFPGYLGSGVLAPPKEDDEYQIIFRFDSQETLSAWEHSASRHAWLERGKGLYDAPHEHRATGLDAWFKVSPGATPPRWKQAVADTWIPHLVRRLNESTGAQVRVRIDAGFTDNATLEALEDREIEYLGRLRSHTGLQKLAAPLLKRPPGRPPEQPREWCHDLEYQAGSWSAPRRVVLVVQERPDDLLLHAFFLVTNLSKFDWPPEKVLALYRKRGSAEAHMGEVKSALDVHLSSTDRGASTVQGVMARNEVSLLLSLYAYQVLHGLRCLLERQTRQGWSLSRMREQVLKVAATLRLHARRITVHLGAAADKWWPTLLKGLPKLTALS